MSRDTPKPWTEAPLTGRLVLADGTVIGGQGLGATGSAVGEVCFNTAMTGYQEILTDPSYAGQIITFTFPHIGNVGANVEDTETSNLAMRSGVRGCVLRARRRPSPSNYRAVEHLDRWLKARGIIALAGVDTRALTARIREKGMPNGVIAHEPSGKFDIDQLKARGAGLAGARGHGPGAGGDRRAELHLGRDALGVGRGLRPAGAARVPCRRRRLRPQAQHPALPGHGRLQGDGGAGHDQRRGHPGAQARRRVPVQRPRRSGGHGRICGAGDQEAGRLAACRCSASASAIRCWRSRSAPRPSRCTRATTAPTIR